MLALAGYVAKQKDSVRLVKSKLRHKRTRVLVILVQILVVLFQMKGLV